MRIKTIASATNSIEAFVGRRRWHEPFGAIALLLGVVSCGAAPSENSETVAEEQSALAGEWVRCYPAPVPTPPGYPQRTECTGNKPPFLACKCYPADTTSSDTVAYKVVALLRPPPGNMSLVSYDSGSTVGTVEQMTRTDQFGLVASFNSTAVDIEGKWTTGSVSGHQDTLLTHNVNTLALGQSSNTLDHAYDTFYIWLNPILNGHQSGITAELSATMAASPVMRSPTGEWISSLGPDGQPRMQVVPISAHALANPWARTPAQQGFFGHLTPEHIEAILALDDLYASPGYNPSEHPEAYRWVKTLELTGPELGAPVVPISGTRIQYDSSHDTIDGSASHIEVTVKAGGKVSFFGVAEFEAKYGVGWTWDFQDTRMNIQGVQKAANITLQTSTPCVHAWVEMYLDLTFGSWVAVPNFTTYSCAFYDYGTQCNVGGVNMHCCPQGTAMVGIRHDHNVFKCAPLASPGGAVTLDTGTVRNNMHVCPYGQVMVGFHGDLNLLACQSIPGNPVTDERVDHYSQDGWPMHVCDSTFLTSAMSGIHLDQNLLSCAIDAGVR